MAKRTRAYVAIGYPESLVDDFVEVLEATHVQTLISPLHDKDKDPQGELKKEHYHILLMFDSLKTEEQAQEIFDQIKATKCIPVASVRGTARYLCHLDDLDKAQYDSGSVVSLNGADFFGLIDLPINKYQAVREMIQFCKEQKNFSFSWLLEYAAEYNENWFRSLCDSSTIVVKEYLKSATWTAQGMPPEEDKHE